MDIQTKFYIGDKVTVYEDNEKTPKTIKAIYVDDNGTHYLVSDWKNSAYVTEGNLSLYGVAVPLPGLTAADTLNVVNG